MRHVQQRIVGVERRAEVVISGKLMTMVMTEHRATSAARTSQRRRNNVKIISDVSRLASSSQTRLSPQPMHQNRAVEQGHLLATSSLAIAVRQRSPAESNATEGRSAKLLGARKRFSTTRTSKY